MRLEIVRDVAALIALVATLPFLAVSLPGDPVYGIGIMLWGQLAASVLTWVLTLFYTVRITGAKLWGYLYDLIPYFALTAVIVPVMYLASGLFETPLLKLSAEAFTGLALYLGANALLRSRVQQQVLAYLRGRF